MKSLLVITSDQNIAKKLRKDGLKDYHIEIRQESANLVDALNAKSYDLVLIDINGINDFKDRFSSMAYNSADPTISNHIQTPILTLSEIRKAAVEKTEINYLTKLLTQHRGRMNKASETAGISSRQLRKLLAKYDIQKERFKIK